MKRRQYKDSDCAEVWRLFCETMHSINAKDYSQSQRDAWALQETSHLAWGKRLVLQDTIVATEDGKIVGFGSIKSPGELDL
ncbi:MAG: hypothetical protein FWD76_03255 [Firmicutes bacterium]|nr:hypothetical protein [Bacillota bacterium]